MRVTANTFPNSLVDQLGKLATRQNRLQNQAATGQRVQLPEDDPAAMRRVMDFQTESRALGQFRKNIAVLKDVAGASYDGMKALKTINDRAREISILADGTKSRLELNTYATEVTQLIHQAAQITNSQYKGNYLFAGTLSNQPAFVEVTNASGQVTSVTYQGNTSVASSEIATGVTVSAQVVGANTTGVGPRGLITDSRTGADVFNHLISLQNNLLAGNTAAITATDQGNLANDEENFLAHYGDNGSLQQRLETTDALADKRSLSLEKAVSADTDADLAQTLVRLNQTQTAYQAALQSGARILGQSLLDYLR